MLGARTFLRGLDYEKRKVVDEVHLNDGSAQGRVKGSDPDPYEVTIRLGGEGITRVMVNGEVIIENNELTGARSGRVLRIGNKA